MQQWTHSIVSWHNFVGPFEAAAIGLTQAFCQELTALNLPVHSSLQDGRVEMEETDVNAERGAAFDLGIREEYPQRSSLAAMDSFSQFEHDLSVGNLSDPQFKASSSPAMSHGDEDRHVSHKGSVYSFLPASRPVGRPHKAVTKVSFSPRVTLWFPPYGQSRVRRKDVFTVGPAPTGRRLVSKEGASFLAPSEWHVGLCPPEAAVAFPDASSFCEPSVWHVGLRPQETAPVVPDTGFSSAPSGCCVVSRPSVFDAAIRGPDCSAACWAGGAGDLTQDPADVIFEDCSDPNPTDVSFAHISALKDVTNCAPTRFGGASFVLCGKELESGPLCSSSDRVLTAQRSTVNQLDALEPLHTNSLLSKGGSCRTLSGDMALTSDASSDSIVPPTGSSLKRPRTRGNFKPSSGHHGTGAGSRLLMCTGESCPSAGRLTCFDKSAGAITVSRPSNLSLADCQFLCMGRSSIVRPLARPLMAKVPNWPSPQILVSSAALADTHRACVLTTDSENPPLVVEVALQKTFVSLIADIAFGLGYPTGTRIAACAANGIVHDCTDVIPVDVDFVQVTLQLPSPLSVSESGLGSLNSGPSSGSESPQGWTYGRKKRAAAPSIGVDQSASQSGSGAQQVQPWTEQPIPGAPAIPVVGGSASSTTSTSPYTSFDYAAGASVQPRPPGLTDDQCLRRAISESYVANPIGRLLRTEVPRWPSPQALVFEYRVLRTHVACVVVIAGFYDSPFVLQVPMHTTMHRVLAMTPVGGDLALVRCLVDNAPIHCDAFLPEGVDYVFFEVTARPPPVLQAAILQQPYTYGASHSDAPFGQASSSSTDAAFGFLPVRPATPPIPEDPWYPESDTFSSSHSGSDWASRLPPFTVFDVVHHVRIMEAHGPLTLAHMAEIAIANTPELRGPFGYRLLRSFVAGYPAPQVVIWEEPAAHSRTFPIFHVGAPKGVCTVCVPARTSAYQVAYLAEASCALPVVFRRDIARLAACLLFDGKSADPHAAFEAGAVDSAVYTQLDPTQSVRVATAPRWRTPYPRHLDSVLPKDISVEECSCEIVVHSMRLLFRFGRLLVTDLYESEMLLQRWFMPRRELAQGCPCSAPCKPVPPSTWDCFFPLISLTLDISQLSTSGGWFLPHGRFFVLPGSPRL